MSPITLGFAGTSNTAIVGIWQNYAREWIVKDYPAYLWSYDTMAVSGWTMFPNLVNLSDLAGSDVIAIDQSNDYDLTTIEIYEGYIRRALTDGYRVVPILIPRWTNNPPTNDEINAPMNETAYNAQKAICEHYGLTPVDYWAYLQSAVPGTYDLSDLQSDQIHMTSVGGERLYDLVKVGLPTRGSGSIPASPLYAGALDYVHDPIIRNGTDHDGITGTWVTDGTKISSTVADSTITFIGTFRRLGCYAASGSNGITVSIDGGAFQSLAFNVHGIDTGSRAEHTIVIKVLTGCYIDEFWAI